MKRNNIHSWLIIGSAFLLSAMVVVILVVVLNSFTDRKAYNLMREETEIQKEAEELVEVVKTPRYLDGVLVEEGEENLFPVAVMIDNHFDARPLSGLNKVQLVIEAPVEGNFSRLLAFYTTSEEIKEIGPVRSARPYFLDWAKGLEAMYLHVGGSPEALKNIVSYNVFNLNEYYNGWYFWRDRNRPGPHNVYTSSELIQEALTDKEASKEGDYAMWKYKEDLAGDQRPSEVRDITIDYSILEFRVDWVYESASNSYLRFVAGEGDLDTLNAEQISAKNVAVQYVRAWVLDDIGRRRIETIGQGGAVVFLDGMTIEGAWKKNARSERTRFYDKTGEEIEFNRGTTWIEVVPEGGSVLY